MASPLPSVDNYIGIGHAYGIQRRSVATLVSTWQYADNLHDCRLTGIAHLDGAAGADSSTLPRSYAYVTKPAKRRGWLSKRANTPPSPRQIPGPTPGSARRA